VRDPGAGGSLSYREMKSRNSRTTSSASSFLIRDPTRSTYPAATATQTRYVLRSRGRPGAVSMESFSRESLLSLLESVESAISELQSRKEPRLEGVISRLERRRAEIVAALASKGRPEQ
jgi:hypothetical protein